MNIISKGHGMMAVIRKNVEQQRLHSKNTDILKLLCASECLRLSKTNRTHPCICFSDC